MPKKKGFKHPQPRLVTLGKGAYKRLGPRTRRWLKRSPYATRVGVSHRGMTYWLGKFPTRRSRRK